MAVRDGSTSVRRVRLGSSDAAAGGLCHVVVPLDGSDWAAEALGPARDLAVRAGAHVSLVTTHMEEEDDFADYLDAAAGRLDGIETEIVLRAEDDPVEAIKAMVAESDEPTWVAMSSHGRGRVRRAVLGSVAERIIAEVDAPVVVVGPSYDRQRHFADGPVIVADDAVHPPDLEVATVLCSAARARAVVLEARAPVPDLHLHRREPHVSTLVAEWADLLRARGVEVTTEIRTAASMARAAADEAIEIGASCILVTSRAHTGLLRFVLGSHTATTVRLSAVPVVVVRAPPEAPVPA